MAQKLRKKWISGIICRYYVNLQMEDDNGALYKPVFHKKFCGLHLLAEEGRNIAIKKYA